MPRAKRDRANSKTAKTDPSHPYPPRPAPLNSMEVGVDGASNGPAEKRAIAAVMALEEAESARSRGSASTYQPTSPSLSPRPMTLTPAEHAAMMASDAGLPHGVNFVFVDFPVAPATVARHWTDVYRIGFDFGKGCGIQLKGLAKAIIDAAATINRQRRVDMSFTIGDDDSRAAGPETIAELQTLLAALAETRPRVDVTIHTPEHQILGLRAFSEEEGELDAHRELYDEFVSRLRVAAE